MLVCGPTMATRDDAGLSLTSLVHLFNTLDIKKYYANYITTHICTPARLEMLDIFTRHKHTYVKLRREGKRSCAYE